MGVIDSLETTSREALHTGEHLIESAKRYYELRIFKQLAITSSTVVKLVLVGSFSLFGLLFTTIALALFLGNHLKNYVQGFLLTSCLLFGIALVIYLMRKKIETMVITKLSKTFFDEL